MRIIYMGTPEFAVEPLKELNKSSHEIVAVVSQPNRERDKKGNLINTPVKQCADELGLVCYQFDRVSDHVDVLKKINCDVIVTVAFGQMLTQGVIDVAPIINVHASLLPKYRGSSPIQSAILCGEKYTGVTLMRTVLKMDAGDILASKMVEIENSDTAGTLSEKLSRVGAKLLVDFLDDYINAQSGRVAQDESKATYCKKLTKQSGIIDWSRSAEEICLQIRAMQPWPVAFTYLNGKNVKLYEARVVDGYEGENGEIFTTKNTMTVKCGKKAVEILSLQAPGKRRLKTEEFLRGFNILQGEKFVSEIDG